MPQKQMRGACCGEGVKKNRRDGKKNGGGEGTNLSLHKKRGISQITMTAFAQIFPKIVAFTGKYFHRADLEITGA